MRKGLLIGVWSLLLLGMTSCYKNTSTVVQGTQWKIADCEVAKSDWQYTYDTDYQPAQYNNNCFYAKFDVPDLSDFVFTDGNVQCYLIETNSLGEQMQRQLPFTRHKEIIEDNKVTGYYTETYDCIYGIGWVEFDYTASDFAYEGSFGKQEITKPQPCLFRVVMTW